MAMLPASSVAAKIEPWRFMVIPLLRHHRHRIRSLAIFAYRLTVLGRLRSGRNLIRPTQERRLSASSIIVAVSALRLFYNVTLKPARVAADEIPTGLQADKPRVRPLGASQVLRPGLRRAVRAPIECGRLGWCEHGNG